MMKEMGTLPVYDDGPLVAEKITLEMFTFLAVKAGLFACP